MAKVMAQGTLFDQIGAIATRGAMRIARTGNRADIGRRKRT